MAFVSAISRIISCSVRRFVCRSSSARRISSAGRLARTARVRGHLLRKPFGPRVRAVLGAEHLKRVPQLRLVAFDRQDVSSPAWTMASADGSCVKCASRVTIRPANPTRSNNAGVAAHSPLLWWRGASSSAIPNSLRKTESKCPSPRGRCRAPPCRHRRGARDLPGPTRGRARGL